MFTPARAAAAGGMAGRKIRLPWPGLDSAVDLRTKELLVIGGAPGAGKSMVAIALACQVSVPVLYVVQDSPASVLARVTANTLGIPVATAHHRLQAKDVATIDRLSTALPPERFVLSPGAHSVTDITNRIMALTEWMGRAPELVIIDNLVDTRSEKGTAAENIFYADVLLKLKQVAIENDTGMVVLHHVTRGGDNDHGLGHQPLRLTDLLFAGEREARHVWGVYNNGKNNITLQVLKQQDGHADPYGNLRHQFSWDPEFGRINERSF